MKLWMAVAFLSLAEGCLYCHNCRPSDAFCYVLRSALTGAQLGFGCASALSELSVHLVERPLAGVRWCGMAKNHTVICACAQTPPLPSPPPPTPSYQGPVTKYVDPWYLRSSLRSTPRPPTTTPHPHSLYPLTAPPHYYHLISYTTGEAFSQRIEPTHTTSTLPDTTTTIFVHESRKIDNFQSAYYDKKQREKVANSASLLRYPHLLIIAASGIRL